MKNWSCRIGPEGFGFFFSRSLRNGTQWLENGLITMPTKFQVSSYHQHSPYWNLSFENFHNISTQKRNYIYLDYLILFSCSKLMFLFKDEQKNQLVIFFRYSNSRDLKMFSIYSKTTTTTTKTQTVFIPSVLYFRAPLHSHYKHYQRKHQLKTG